MSSTRTILVAARRVALSGAGVAIAASAFIAPATAHAATARNGVCDSGEFCLSYNSGFTGSVSDFAAGSNVSDFGATEPTCYDFKSSGAGQGLCVKNHAAAARNLTSQTVTLYVNSNYGGATQSIAPGQTVNLNPSLKNNEAAMQFSSPTSTGAVCANTFGNPRTCAQAVAWMQAHEGPSHESSDYISMCDHTMGLAYGFSASGSTSAINHWNQDLPSAYKHPGDRNVPAGGLAFFSGGTSGHVMMSIGNGQFLSTDIDQRGVISQTTIATVESRWGKTYVGWSQPWFKANH